MPPTSPFTTADSAAMAVHKQQQHFLVVTVEAQGHINPARRLASRLISFGRARVTLALPTSAYNRMFPSTEVAEDGDGDGDELISYIHYPYLTSDNSKFVPSEINLRIKDSLSCIATDLAASGRPVTCIIYSLFLLGAAELARDLVIPSVLFWIQPAAVFAVYNSYFHGYTDIIRAHQNDPSFIVDLPGLPSLQIRDLPSFLTSTNFDANTGLAFFIDFFKDMFEKLDKEAACKPRVLVNTFQELENEVLSSIQGMEMITVGPLVLSEQTNLKPSPDLYEEDSRGYMEWLDRQAERSVVYVSFGSISKMSGRQMEEIAKGLTESGRRYLWVVRRNNGEDIVGMPEGEEEMGMVVEWCSQNRVLSHRSVGCFVTHCGWNSMLESMLYGVPMVMAPQWSDQATNARLAEGEWGTGVRAALDGEGVLEGRELRRCLDVVMGEGKRGSEITMRAAMWRDKALEAVGQGGSSVKDLKAFVESLDTIGTSETSVNSSSQ